MTGCTGLILARGNWARNIRKIQALLIILTIPRCETWVSNGPPQPGTAYIRLSWDKATTVRAPRLKIATANCFEVRRGKRVVVSSVGKRLGTCRSECWVGRNEPCSCFCMIWAILVGPLCAGTVSTATPISEGQIGGNWHAITASKSRLSTSD